MNSCLFCIVFWICSLDIFKSFSILIHGSREYFLCSNLKSSCFCKASFSSLVIWAIYFRCWILQKDDIFVVLVIKRRFSLSITYAQSRPSGSGTVTPRLLCFLFSFYIFRGTFLRLYPLVIIFLRKPFQMVSSFLSSLAASSQD